MPRLPAIAEPWCLRPGCGPGTALAWWPPHQWARCSRPVPRTWPAPSHPPKGARLTALLPLGASPPAGSVPSPGQACVACVLPSTPEASLCDFACCPPLCPVPRAGHWLSCTRRPRDPLLTSRVRRHGQRALPSAGQARRPGRELHWTGLLAVASGGPTDLPWKAQQPGAKPQKARGGH